MGEGEKQPQVGLEPTTLALVVLLLVFNITIMYHICPNKGATLTYRQHKGFSPTLLT